MKKEGRKACDEEATIIRCHLQVINHPYVFYESMRMSK